MADAGGVEPDHPEPGPEPEAFQLFMDQNQVAGVYANYAQVSQSDYEFTIDFARLDFGRKMGMTVARINASPVFVEQLVRVLTDELERYAQKALQEVLPDVADDQGEGAGDGSAES